MTKDHSLAYVETAMKEMGKFVKVAKPQSEYKGKGVST